MPIRTARWAKKIVIKAKNKIFRAVVEQEILLKAWLSYISDPRVHIKHFEHRLGIPKVDNRIDGQNPTNIAIFVAFASILSKSNQYYISALKEAGYSIVYINNAKTEEVYIPILKELTWLAFDRINAGRDFGAYQDGVLFLQKEGCFSSCKTLCMANDSMQFIPGLFSNLFVDAIKNFQSGKKSALFSHESHQVHSHYQSYFQIIKAKIFNSKLFHDFWHSYIPLDNRGHCINSGEIALSKKVYRNFSDSQLLYSSDLLALAIHNIKRQNSATPFYLNDCVRLMPLMDRTIAYGYTSRSLVDIAYRSKNNREISDIDVAKICDFIELSNPSHMAAFLYPFFLQCPLVKHDLCLAGTFNYGQAISLFSEMIHISLGIDKPTQQAMDLINEFRERLFSKGVASDYSGRPYAAIRNGIQGGFVYQQPFRGLR